MPDIKYVGALPLITLNMWPSINCSTLYSIGSSPTCLNSLAPTWNLHGAFNINLIILFWVHVVIQHIHKGLLFNMSTTCCYSTYPQRVFIRHVFNVLLFGDTVISVRRIFWWTSEQYDYAKVCQPARETHSKRRHCTLLE